MLRLEFTIEPFVDGQPGPHVLAGVAAAEALGATVEFGPFGSSCTVADADAGGVLSALVDAAVANGATAIAVAIELVHPPAEAER
jgi:hypothetical protein